MNERPRTMTPIFELTDKQVEQLYGLYQFAWWARHRTLDETRRCAKGSTMCFGFVDEEHNLVAFTRVLTDYTFKALMFDVIVHPDHQDKGLGHQLVTLVKEDPRLQEVHHIELYCLPELQKFYASFGFTTDVGNMALMRLNRTAA